MISREAEHDLYDTRLGLIMRHPDRDGAQGVTAMNSDGSGSGRRARLRITPTGVEVEGSCLLGCLFRPCPHLGRPPEGSRINKIECDLLKQDHVHQKAAPDVLDKSHSTTGIMTY
jgi:hypothetical protein